MEEIADAVGVGRRTLFRDYGSKDEILWGDFASALREFRKILSALPKDISLVEALHRGVVQFNHFGPDAYPLHYQRMKLIVNNPALKVHSSRQYGEWRAIVAEYVAARIGSEANAPFPKTIAYLCLGVALAAYEHWLDDRTVELEDAFDEAFQVLADFAVPD